MRLKKEWISKINLWVIKSIALYRISGDGYWIQTIHTDL